VGPRADPVAVARKKNTPTLPGIEPRSPNPLPSHYTELPRLLG